MSEPKSKPRKSPRSRSTKRWPRLKSTESLTYSGIHPAKPAIIVKDSERLSAAT